MFEGIRGSEMRPIYDEGPRKQLAKLWAKLERRRRFRTGGFVENLLYSTKRLAINVDISENSFDATVGRVPWTPTRLPLPNGRIIVVKEPDSQYGRRWTRREPGRAGSIAS